MEKLASPFLQGRTPAKGGDERKSSAAVSLDVTTSLSFCDACQKVLPTSSRFCLFCGARAAGPQAHQRSQELLSPPPVKQRKELHNPVALNPLTINRLVDRRHSSATLLLNDPANAEEVQGLLLPFIEEFQRAHRFEAEGRTGAVRHWHEYPYLPTPTASVRKGSDLTRSSWTSHPSLPKKDILHLQLAPPFRKLDEPRTCCDLLSSFCRHLGKSFMGESPVWYKLAIIFFLILNIFVSFISPMVTGWLVLMEFIFTLMMALKCYPLEPGGLLAVEVVVLGLTSAESVYHEIERNLEVILLLIFMVAATHFLKKMLLYVFSKVLLAFNQKILLCLAFQVVAAILSAFLDALTVTAVLIHVIMGLYDIYAYRPGQSTHADSARSSPHAHLLTKEQTGDDQQFTCFLRELLMHSLLGTALGGGLTAVGEPQNLLIAELSHWTFVGYFIRLLPVAGPVFIAGMMTNAFCEKFKIFGYGTELPPNVRMIIEQHKEKEIEAMTDADMTSLICQGLVSGFIIIALGMQLAAVGIIGLVAIILVTTLNGITEEEYIGKAFQDSLPFTALLCVFFAIVAMLDDLRMFYGLIEFVINMEDFRLEILLFFIMTGVLSMISDNVFVATIYIVELYAVMVAGDLPRDQYDILAVSVNSGTNVLSVATPNGQAAFLFLLTSSLAPTLDLSYFRMVYMALPYTVTMTAAGIIGNYYFLESGTAYFLKAGLIPHLDVPDAIVC